MQFRLSTAILRHLARGSFVLALLILSTQVLAEVPRAVALLYFRGTGLDRAISLEWATATELNTAGYRLERAEASAGPFLRLDQIGIVPAIGDSLQGAEYVATDRDGLQNGIEYWYKLVEIEFNGTENPIGPIPVVAGIQEPTATNTRIPATSPPATTSANSSPTTSVTPSPTATAGASTPQSSPSPTLNANPSGPATSAANALVATAQPRVADSLAQGSTSLQETAYPGQSQETLVAPAGTPITGEGYPPVGTDPAVPPTEAYPLSIDPEDRVDSGEPIVIPTGTLAALIGEVSEAEIAPPQEDVSETTSSSTLLLWTGFFVALMVFIAVVVGSIVYFRR